ncbi:hypothetical protein [Mesorhizobium sp. dw_380]|uniref:hypothetical protein n=1 Tax=Mesorhizobium sp. dw_380 TaxID=2812001 RepID=UPI001BDDDAA9|nr:hypothetical protein [Mesorhizobium sp. dw_380]
MTMKKNAQMALCCFDLNQFEQLIGWFRPDPLFSSKLIDDPQLAILVQTIADPTDADLGSRGQ